MGACRRLRFILPSSKAFIYQRRFLFLGGWEEWELISMFCLCAPARARAHVRIETSSQTSRKLPNVCRSNAYSRITSSHFGRMGGSELHIARLLPRLFCRAAIDDADRMTLCVDEIVHVLGEL